MSVQLKVYTFWNDNDQAEVRRLELQKNVVENFRKLNSILLGIFPKLKGKSFSITWKDYEGDAVMISSDDEIIIALKSMPDDIKKFYIHCKDTEQMNNDSDNVRPTVSVNAPSCSNVQHVGIICDGCDSAVTGYRYSCIQCIDFDLCAKCEGEGKHANHCMLRLPKPSLPHPVVKSATKKSRQLLKSLEGQLKKVREMEKRYREEERQGNNGWLNMLSSYMDEYTNLAGDIGIDTRHHQLRQSVQTLNERISNNVADIRKYLLDTSENKIASEPVPTCVDSSLGQGDSVFLDVKKDAKSALPKAEAPPAKASTSTDKTKKDESPDRMNDWTVINTDVMGTDNVASEYPIDFNQPEKFQEKISFSETQNLYPPLNTSTAVLKPNESPKTEQQLPKPSATEGKNSEDNDADLLKGTRHPMAHIQAAVDQMMAMGFTNECNWLTTLVENKNGNISAVLDLLTPVVSRK